MSVSSAPMNTSITNLGQIGFPINKDLVDYDRQLGVYYIYDIHTTNISFLQTAKHLSMLGVKNNKFFLKLYDPKLIGVDPYDKSLSQEMMKRIIIETMRNPWYFLRELSRIPEQGGGIVAGSGTRFQLHRANLAAIYCYLHNINFYMVIPRQCGKTQSVVAILLWTFLFGTTNSEMSFINKDQDGANENLRRMKDQRDLLPVFMQQKYQFVDGEIKPAKGVDRIQMLSNPMNGNRIVTKPKATSMEKAESIGRGNTSPIQLYDEVEFTEHIGAISMAAGPAYVQAAKNAAKNHTPYCRIYITTPGFVDTEPVESSAPLRDQSTRWSDHMLDKSESELFDYLNKNSEISMFYIEYSYRQIGKDEAWYQSMCKQLLFDRLRIKREILLMRIRGTTDSPFDPDDLDQINGLEGSVIEERILNKIFMIRLYEKLNTQIPYIIGVDCATGTNNDNTAISIVDPYKEKAVGEAKTPLMDVVDVCTFLRLLIRDVCPRGILAIERNSLGDAVIQILKRTEVSHNLYYDADAFLVGDPDEKLDAHGFIKQEAENRRTFGVYTNGKSREIMMQIMLRLAVEKKEAFNTRYIIDDLNNLIKKASGKIEARYGYHDDNIMSFLIAMYIRYHGKKLVNWGFVPGGTPTDEDLKPMKYEDLYEEMTPQMKKWFNPPAKKDPYEDQIKEAIRRSQMERSNFSNSDGAVVTKDDKLDMDYNNIMYGDNYSMEDDVFFADLNS